MGKNASKSQEEATMANEVTPYIPNKPQMPYCYLTKEAVVKDGEVPVPLIAYLIGDSGVGKSTLICQTLLQTPQTNVICGYYPALRRLDTVLYSMALSEPSNLPEYTALRQVGYPTHHVVVLCFSLVHRPSWENIDKVWAPEALEYAPDIPRMVVGTHLALRKPSDKNHMTIQEGKQLADKWGAYTYVEVDSLDMNINELESFFLQKVVEGLTTPPSPIKPAKKKKK